MRALLCLVIAAASAALGLALNREQSAKLRRLDALIASLDTLRAEISGRLTPLPDCAEQLANGGPAEARGFYACLCAALPALGELEFAQIWSACLAELELPSGALGPLEDLGRSLGRFDAAAQCVALERCTASLSGLSRACRAGAAQLARLRLGLALSAGLLLAVTLY